MKRILVLNQWSILPAHSGGQQAMVALCQALGQRHDCHLATPDHSASVFQAPRQEKGFVSHRIPARDFNTWRGRLWVPSLWFDRPTYKHAFRYAHHPGLVDTLENLLRQFDLVVLTHPWMWPLVSRTVRGKTMPLIYDAHNAETQIAEDLHRTGQLNAAQTWRIRRLERDLCRRADHILCCTTDDQAFFSNRFGVPHHKMSTGFKGVDCDRYTDLGLPWEQRLRSGLFMGSRWGPNLEAAGIIDRQLAPQMPEMQFNIAGTCGDPASVTSPNVAALGFVNDLPKILGESLVALNPIVSGSGINMKVLEYMAAGIPVLSTPFGARGLQEVGDGALLIRELSDFPQAIRQLSEDGALWNRLAQQGRAVARNHFDLPVMTQRINHLIDQMLPS